MTANNPSIAIQKKVTMFIPSKASGTYKTIKNLCQTCTLAQLENTNSGHPVTVKKKQSCFQKQYYLCETYLNSYQNKLMKLTPLQLLVG